MANLDNLRITDRELDELTGLDISDITMGWAYRQAAFAPQHRLFWLGGQLLSCGVMMIFCLPITLLLIRAASNNNATTVSAWLPVGAVIAIALTIVLTLYRWQAGKRLLKLSHLLDDIDRFNETVTAVEILEELTVVRNSIATTRQPNLENREQVLEALHLTRESLICGLMTEKVMRTHRQLMARQQDMFANIERNLATLQLMQVNESASDYSRLLNDAIQIGTSVHRELAQPLGHREER
ncbi:MAG: hypothetical protein AAFY54_05355 [Cyanobacteria bacterium J06648_10]